MSDQIDPIKAANEAEMPKDQNRIQGGGAVSPDDLVNITFTRGEIEQAKAALQQLAALPEVQQGPLAAAVQMLSQAIESVGKEADDQLEAQRGQDQNSPENLAAEIGGMVNARR